MFEEQVAINFLAPPCLVRDLERVRRKRMKRNGHISRSALLRELLSEKLEEALGTEQKCIAERNR